MKIRSKCLIISFFIDILLLTSLFSSCRDDKSLIFQKYYNLSPNGLSSDVQYSFSPFEIIEKDSLFLSNFNAIDSYDINLILRLNDNCKLRQIPLTVEVGSLYLDSIIQKNFNVEFFDDKDLFLGKGNYGIYEKKIKIAELKKYQEGLFVSVSTTEKSTPGILTLGIECKTKSIRN